MKKQIIALITLAMIIGSVDAQNAFLKREGIGFAKIGSNTSGKSGIDTDRIRALVIPVTAVQNSIAKRSWNGRSDVSDTKIKTIISHLYYVNVIILIIIFLTEFLIE